MLKGFVSGEEKDIKRIPMKGKNLFDKNSDTTNNNGYTRPGVEVPAGTYSIDNGTPHHVYYRVGYSGIAQQTNPGMKTERIVASDSLYVWRDANIREDGVMLNLGSQPLPYEPYGYHEGWEVRDNQDRLIWGREDELQTATGTLPFKGYTLPVKVKTLLGNAVQNGTPAPDNIVTPEMCGVRTGNMWDEQYLLGYYSSSGVYTSADNQLCTKNKISVMPETQYFLGVPSRYENQFLAVSTYGADGAFIERQVLPAYTGDGVQYTTNADTHFININFSTYYGTTYRNNIMISKSATLQTYEPYGWKVPFENHGENLVDAAIVQSGYYGGTNPGHDIFVSDNKYRAFQMQLNAGTYTLLIGAEESIRLLRVSNDIDGVVTVYTDDAPYAFTLSQDTNIYVSFRNQDTTDSFTNLKIMLTLGSTPKPYSPYLNATIPVYLGEVPTVRRVKKLVLTGNNETFTKNDADPTHYLYHTGVSTFPNSVTKTPLLCNELPVTNSAPQFQIGINSNNNFNVVYINFGSDVMNAQPHGNTATGLKEYLAAQYAAGHPVIVWYVLSTPETAISNEPLCKISTYADELTTIQVHGLSAPLYGIGDYKDTLNLSTGVVTRKVKKLVLTGTEEIYSASTDSNRTVCRLPLLGCSGNYGFCTHIEWKSPYQDTEYDRLVWNNNSGGSLFISISNIYLTSQSVYSMKAYFAAQYAAGTPVTVWYVLDTPETETVTVPTGMTGEIEGYLTQVSTPSPTNRSVPKWNGEEETGGTYAVTVYTPPEIPTTTGQNTLTVDSNLAPSKLEVSIHAKKIHYGFKIDKSNDNSESAVIYTHDAVTMTPAHMDFTNDRFDYGSWGNAFFVRDCYPVALNLDGTIAYRLDPDDYTKKTDGTASDIFYELLSTAPSDWNTQWKQYYTKSGDEYVLNDQASAPTFAQDTYYKLTYNSSFTGNFMMAFPKVWFYRHEDSQYNYIEISNYKLSDDWKCYAHINASGQEVDFIYLPLFKGVIVNSKLRSLPGQIPQGGTTATDEVNAATALGSRWQIWDHSSVECLNDLLTLMSKSIDSQGRFGQGRSTGYDPADTVTYGKLQTGTLIKKGKFRGYSVTTKEVKVFGLEGFWANRFDRLQGMLLMNNVWKIKMTPPYNFTGTDFVTLSTAEVPSGTGFLSRVQTSEYGSIPASIANGSGTKYFKDPFFKSATNTCVALRGGSCTDGGNAGFRYINVDSAASVSYWPIGASPVYK